MTGERFELSYDLIVLDESENLISYTDEITMNKETFEIWFFFSEMMNHSRKIVGMDGDVSQRSLTLAPSYGSTLLCKNNNNKTNKTMNRPNPPNERQCCGKT